MKITSFTGAFEGMTEIDYNVFLDLIKQSKHDLFHRGVTKRNKFLWIENNKLVIVVSC